MPSRGIGGQHLLVNAGQVSAWIDAEFFREPGPEPGVSAQRVRLTAASVQGQHQQGMQPLLQRMDAGKLAQLPDHVGREAQVQVGVDPRLDGLQSQLRKPRNLPRGQQL